ncbi:MAG: phosphate starvation-inducible protein PhoH [Deltaproteobacteria bacterium]|nr:MAG: phosphate starvation-inducible protein PhoH [Deltaproteobacteria bacterium]
MAEKLIYLEGVDPVDFYGVNNVRFNKFVELFPDIKIVSRGNEIRINGEKRRLEEFEEKVDLFVHYLRKFQTVTLPVMEDLLNGSGNHKKQTSGPDDEVLLYGESGRKVRAITINQKKLVNEGLNNDLLIAVGPAGTGKTYTAIAMAVKALKEREVKRIILTRPAVEAGEKLGFLPGDFKEKLDPYLQPLYDALRDMIQARKLIQFLEDGTIQIAPLAYMRGRTLDEAFVILDEAQNATPSQFKMFLTRMGPQARFVVTGDDTQVDLPRRSDSGLVQAMSILKGIKGISIIRFDDRDIIRHGLVKSIVRAYDGQSKVESEKYKEKK